MAKLEKFLKKLSSEERQRVKDILIKLLSGELHTLHTLDVKKLKGHKSLYRIRKGDLRIVFFQEEGTPSVVFIGKRGDFRYKRF